MIALGTIDQDVTSASVNEYLSEVKKLTIESWGNKLRGEADGEWVTLQPSPNPAPMTVRQVQTFLHGAGFFPHGDIDGICGYRTSAAIRLFQEYIRTVEKIADIGFPDGKFGNKSATHAQRWQAANQQADWTAFSATNQSAEYQQWLTLLKNYQAQAPSRAVQKVSAFTGASDSVKQANWDFDPNKLHLVGIRRMQAGGPAPAEQRFDDVFVLLINGIVFKFFGTTDPGDTTSPKGYPFLLPGQHLFRFGWHKLSDKTHGVNRVYHALKPLSTATAKPTGVLIVRSKDLLLTDADLAAPVEPNPTINVHWGGEGGGAVNAWSEGCQVFAGKAYVNHHDEVINCAAFAANGYSELGKQNAQGVSQTKGAYSVLEDLVTALSGADNVVHYTLLNEADLARNPNFGAGLAVELLNRMKTA